jgi:hypothetical protein
MPVGCSSAVHAVTHQTRVRRLALAALLAILAVPGSPMLTGGAPPAVAGSGDPDADGLSTAFETSWSLTDPLLRDTPTATASTTATRITTLIA